MTCSAIFGIIVGLAMIGQWSFSYLSRQIPELEDEPIRIGFHIAAEIVTAVSLILSGIALLADKSWAGAVYLVAFGMLLYTAIASPGYFAQKGDWKWLGLFAALIGFGLISLVALI